MRLHLSAWKMGLKSLYYLKSSSLLTKKRQQSTQVVTKADCPWCVRLKELLRSEGVSFVELSKEEAVKQNIWREEFKTVPQLWLNGRHIGGYTDYVQLKQQTPETKYGECTACEA
jgi:glutaredoxin